MTTPQPHEIISIFGHRGAIPKGKKITMTLMWGVIARAYQVKSITNTTYYRPGEWMCPEVAEQCAVLPDWEVTSVQDDIINAVTGLAGAIVGVKSVSGLI